MSALLAKTRASFGPAPRRLKTIDVLTPPSWMKNDALRSTYDTRHALLLDGDVVWGHVVQANSLLFTPGDAACPAAVLFASRVDDDPDPDRLEPAADAAFALKGTTPADPATARIAAALTNEQERYAPLDVPDSVTHGMPMRLAPVMVHRELLPCRYLPTLALPLVVSRARDAVTLLPRRHWVEDLVHGWLALGARAR